MKKSTARISLGSLKLLASTLTIFLLIGLKIAHASEKPFRNLELQVFNPHMTDFTCEVEVRKVPPIDPRAEVLFGEASALEAPDQIVEPDFTKIVQLTRMAAERRHWKAMLNLATLYLEAGTRNLA